MLKKTKQNKTKTCWGAYTVDGDTEKSIRMQGGDLKCLEKKKTMNKAKTRNQESGAT